AAKNITGRTEEATNQVAKQSTNVAGESRKRTAQTNATVEAKKQKTTSQGRKRLSLTPGSHLSWKSLMEVEMKLVCVDEDIIYFEFPYDVVYPNAHAQSEQSDAETTGAPKNPQDSDLPCVDKELKNILIKASDFYRGKKYKEAEEVLSTALELCSKGNAIEKTFDPAPEDISSIVSFIETKLALCCLKLKKPKEALNHAHRSITLNPFYFRNHLRQAATFRCLRRYSEAARSAMIADYIYWLRGGTDQNTVELIRQYWQAMIEEALMDQVSFSVMYTPFPTEVQADEIDKIKDKINKLKDKFAQKNPNYVQHIYTDPHGYHILPQTTNRQFLPPKPYMMTLGFRNKRIGKIMEKLSNKVVPITSDRKKPFAPLTEEDAERYWNNTAKEIIPIMDFIRSTKLIDHRCPCARGIEKMHEAVLLGGMQRVEEQSQVLNQAMAELATLPYLQTLRDQDIKLLLLLMSDAMDTLAGIKCEQRAWDDIEQV
ncbi:SPT16 protein, partial [Chloroceryle aenea]|nr:SPT16 protein [Chloroceryle aenea]